MLPKYKASVNYKLIYTVYQLPVTYSYVYKMAPIYVHMYIFHFYLFI